MIYTPPAERIVFGKKGYLWSTVLMAKKGDVDRIFSTFMV